MILEKTKEKTTKDDSFSKLLKKAELEYEIYLKKVYKYLRPIK